MSIHVEVSPNGIGFIRAVARKSIPGEPAAAKDAPLRAWLTSRNDSMRSTATDSEGSTAE